MWPPAKFTVKYNPQELNRFNVVIDLLYFPFRPADLIVGVWTAMETVDSDNGCLVVVPGSHKNGKLHRHATQQFQTGAFKTFYGVKDMQDTEVVPLHMEKGDTVFLHPLLIHGSGPNKSKSWNSSLPSLVLDIVQSILNKLVVFQPSSLLAPANRQ
ncbi:hypothetical protein J6590_037964 [Homalodisca vitripennis]|nr:hypothetical protein J6590_037964 [Homalodisca vitripennis]